MSILLVRQIVSILGLSAIIALVFNFFRSVPLPFIKPPVEIVSNQGDLVLRTIQPTIIGVDITMAKKLFDDNILFVDAREESYFNEGHIPKSICFDEFELLIVKLESLIDMDDPFVVYCSDDDCGSSEELSYELQSYGFTNILLFKGGWKQWQEANYPTSKT